MISISRLYCGVTKPDDHLRYGSGTSSAANRRPVVVWNCTRRCNLSCQHCYTDSENRAYAGELNTDEAKQMIDDLSEYQVPVILISGGEPLLRPDLFELLDHCLEKKTAGYHIDQRHPDYS